jgi:hypothetical protein
MVKNIRNMRIPMPPVDMSVRFHDLSWPLKISVIYGLIASFVLAAWIILVILAAFFMAMFSMGFGMR